MKDEPLSKQKVESLHEDLTDGQGVPDDLSPDDAISRFEEEKLSAHEVGAMSAASLKLDMARNIKEKIEERPESIDVHMFATYIHLCTPVKLTEDDAMDLL